MADPFDAEYIRAPEYQVALFSETGFLQGDCDDAATLAAALLVALDTRGAYIIAIRTPGQTDFSHVFVRVFYPDGQLDIDPIVPAGRLPIQNIAESITVPI